MLEAGILTIANGSVPYYEMAKSLAISIRRFSPGIPIAVVTDNPDALKSHFDLVIPSDPTRGKSVNQKLYIDLYSPFKKTLFIDSDCIVFTDLHYVFDAFEGGNCVISNDVYDLSHRNPRELDFSRLEKKTGLNELHGFNGGVYYVEAGTLSETAFRQARSILSDFVGYGIPDFRDGEPNDEYVLAIALSVCKVPLAEVSRQVMQIPLGLDGELRLDVISGTVAFSVWGRPVNPAIVHFCGYFRDWPIYSRECLKLRVLGKGHWYSVSLAWLAGHYHDVRIKFRRRSKQVWGLMPRRIRLLSHAVRTRITSSTRVVK
ncbi:MAG: hypothetical protein U0936_07160 [Planctomycetaceae bacterium]